MLPILPLRHKLLQQIHIGKVLRTIATINLTSSPTIEKYNMTNPPLPPIKPLRHFNTNYSETAVLTDGTIAKLRLIRPSDHDLWIQFFDNLSDHTKYMRFCSCKKSASENEVRYFTCPDQEKHFGIIALTSSTQEEEKESSPSTRTSYNEDATGGASDDDDGQQIIGIGRFICLIDNNNKSTTGTTSCCTLAEPAVTVLDHFQGKGLGSLLILRLIAAAHERGVQKFESNILASNGRILHLMNDLSINIDSAKASCGDVVVTTSLPYISPNESWSHHMQHIHHEQQQQQQRQDQSRL